LPSLADRGLRLFAVVPVVPELGREEKFAARDAAPRDRRADALLVAVDRGGVDVPVPDREGFGHGALGVGRRNLEDAVAELGDVVAVVELHRGDRHRSSLGDR
jgi:hypothetical protein